MNRDQIEGKWTEIKGQMRAHYGDMTDDELESAKGDREQMEGLLQQKYGKSKEEARAAVDDIFAKA